MLITKVNGRKIVGVIGVKVCYSNFHSSFVLQTLEPCRTLPSQDNKNNKYGNIALSNLERTIFVCM